jgi:hypothetical protein
VINKKLQIFLLCTFIAGQALGRNCFLNHLKEAIALNKIRKPMYSALSQGKTEEISNLMIFNERLIMPLAYAFDLWADRLQSEGYPIICEDFLPMDSIGDFQSSRSVPVNIIYQPLPLVDIQKSLYRVMSENSGETQFRKVSEEIQNIIGNRSETPYFNCMGIHVLTSIDRSSKNAINFLQTARQKQNQSQTRRLENFYRSFIRTQIRALNSTYEIDKKSSVFQKQGIPMICADVP